MKKISIIKLLSVLLLALMLLPTLAACKKDPVNPPEGSSEGDVTTEVPGGEDGPNIEIRDIDPDFVVDYTDCASIYEAIGQKVTIDYVEEDPDTGLAYVTLGGKTYELGLDFLSMAMVYRTDAIEGNAAFDTADEIYLEWWRLYIQRWNYLSPEIPLYSNVYYDLYLNTINGFETTPFWGTANAMLYASMKDAAAESKYIIGSTTELSGSFRYYTWAVSSGNAADADISTLTQGLSTVETNKSGLYVWSDTVVKAHEETANEDGSKTFKITIKEGLKFSDGSPVTAKNYLYQILAFSSPVAAEAMGMDKQAGMSYVGYEAFAEATAAGQVFSGLRLYDDYTFSVQVAADYLPYYYELGYAGFSPVYKDLWFGAESDIKDDGNGVYITGNFYDKDAEGKYALAAHMLASKDDNSTEKYPFSGPYVIKAWDDATKQVTLELNPNFAGNFEGQKPSIKTLVYVKVVQATMFQQLEEGGVNVIAGITGGTDTEKALNLVKDTSKNFAEVHYDRAGYGKLGFRCDVGASQFAEVRRAVSYIIDKNEFCQQFTGGYGALVYGPYCNAQWMYEGCKDKLNVNAYAVSVDAAIDELVKGGWVYGADGKAYTSGIRYKKLTADEATEQDIAYQSKDGAYKTVKIGDDYYMPLVINWYCSEDNDVSEMLKIFFSGNENLEKIGMTVQYTQGSFNALLGELYQEPSYGYKGPAMYSAFNFATSFSSAMYDYSWNFTVDPELYNTYQIYFIKDAADLIPAEK